MTRPSLSPRLRGVLAGILAVLTCVLLLMSILAVWAGRTVGRLSVTTAAVAVAVGLAGWVSVAWARGATRAAGTVPDGVDVDA